MANDPQKTPPLTIEAMSIVQTADGRLFLKIKTDVAQTKTDQAIINYSTFFVGSPVSSSQRNAV